MKKWLCVVMSMVMFFAVSVPVMAAENDEDELLNVTRKDLVTGEVTAFDIPIIESDNMTAEGYLPESMSVDIDLDDPDNMVAPRSPIGDDKRVEMTTYDKRIVHLRVYFPGESDPVNCTGFLVSNNAVATAAHCVYNFNNSSRFASRVEVYPGLKGEPTSSSLKYDSSDIFVPSAYYSTGSRNRALDYAIIYLASPANVGYFGFTTSHPSNASITVTGYPAEVEGYPHKKIYYQFTDSGTMVQSGVYIYHNADTSGSQSGAPIYSGSTVHGIHTSGVGDLTNMNSGVAINSAIYNMFMATR